MRFLIFALLAVSTFTFAQKLVDLKSFRGGADTKIDATAPYSIYVSASSDDRTTLENVFVKTADSTRSLWQIKNFKLFQNSGLLQPTVVTEEAYISTTLSNDQMNKLKGYLYITTEKQMKNNNGFLVYDVSMNEKISTAASPSDMTHVFLNTDFTSSPWQSTTISFWNQNSDSFASIYQGIPTDDVERDSTQIFSNPVTIASGDTVLFQTVEQFSLSLGAFYVKSHKGVSFIIQPKYTDVDGSQTTAMTTTGLYMKPLGSVDRKVTILTARDPKYNGKVGANLIGNVPEKSSVAISENDGVNYSYNVVTPVDQILGWSTDAIGQNLTIESVGTTAGEFFVQFYVIQGTQQSGTTLPGRQTTAGYIETTTKSSAFVTFLGSLLIPILGSRLL